MALGLRIALVERSLQGVHTVVSAPDPVNFPYLDSTCCGQFV